MAYVGHSSTKNTGFVPYPGRPYGTNARCLISTDFTLRTRQHFRDVTKGKWRHNRLESFRCQHQMGSLLPLAIVFMSLVMALGVVMLILLAVNQRIIPPGWVPVDPFSINTSLERSTLFGTSLPNQDKGFNTLTHWPLGDLDAVYKNHIPILFPWFVASDPLKLMPSDECRGTLLITS